MTTKKKTKLNFHQGMRVMINGEQVDLDKPLPPKAHLIATFSDELDKPAKVIEYKVEVLSPNDGVWYGCGIRDTLNAAYRCAEEWNNNGKETRVVEY